MSVRCNHFRNVDLFAGGVSRFCLRARVICTEEVTISFAIGVKGRGVIVVDKTGRESVNCEGRLCNSGIAWTVTIVLEASFNHLPMSLGWKGVMLLLLNHPRWENPFSP